MAALDEEDVVDVGAGGTLVQGQPLETNVSRQVFVKHPCPCGTKIRNLKCCFFCSLKLKTSYCILPLHRDTIFSRVEKTTCPVEPVSLKLLSIIPFEHLTKEVELLVEFKCKLITDH